MESRSRPRVLILGAYHKENPNLDAVKTDFGDVLAGPAHRQIQAVVDNLKRFAPTHGGPGAGLHGGDAGDHQAD